MEPVKNHPVEPLSKREEKLFAGSEADIDKNLRGFKEVGKGLMFIRDQRLYRIDYSTFEEYCQGKWDTSRQQAHRLIDAYEVMKNLSTMADKTPEPPSDTLSPMGDKIVCNVNHGLQKPFSTLPANERQARPLTPFSTEKQIAIWTLVLKTAKETGSPVTAILIQQCANALFRKEITKKIREAKSGTRKEKVIPELVQETFNAFLDVVQTQTDADWDEVSRKQMADMLRSILKTIDN